MLSKIARFALPIIAFLLGVALTFYYFMKPAEISNAGWQLEERSIPHPDHISPLMTDVIAGTPQPSYNEKQLVPPNADGWKKLIKLADDARFPSVTAALEAYNPTVETMEINGVTVRKVIPSEIDPKFEQSFFVHIHGGAMVLGGGEGGLGETIVVAQHLKIPVISIDYRMPPDHPYPAALDDSFNAYNGIKEAYPDHHLFMGGTSAGGQLVMATILKLKQAGKPLPVALQLGTPWSDFTKTGDSYYTNEGVDKILVTNDGFLDACARLYANGTDLKDPFISPVYGDLTGFPPTQLVTGTRDLFLSNTVRVHQKLRAGGSKADLIVLEGFSHADYLFHAQSPETSMVYRDLKAMFIGVLENLTDES